MSEKRIELFVCQYRYKKKKSKAVFILLLSSSIFKWLILLQWPTTSVIMMQALCFALSSPPTCSYLIILCTYGYLILMELATQTTWDSYICSTCVWKHLDSKQFVFQQNWHITKLHRIFVAIFIHYWNQISFLLFLYFFLMNILKIIFCLYFFTVVY